MHDRESKRGEKRGPNVRVLVMESLKDKKTPRRKRSEHGGRMESRWESAEKGETLELMSMYDCESKRRQGWTKGGCICGVFPEGQTPKRRRARHGGRQERCGQSSKKRERFGLMPVRDCESKTANRGIKRSNILCAKSEGQDTEEKKERWR